VAGYAPAGHIDNLTVIVLCVMFFRNQNPVLKTRSAYGTVGTIAGNERKRPADQKKTVKFQKLYSLGYSSFEDCKF
jgi:hypothetical protein